MWLSGLVSFLCERSSKVLFVTGGKSAHRRSWFLLGKQVSPTCCMALLGMGNDRLNRVLQHKLDMRRSYGNETQLSIDTIELTYPLEFPL